MSDSISELIFYHAPRSRSGIVRWLLEEIGEPYELRLVRFHDESWDRQAFLEINPLGKVPVLVHRDVVVTEAAAICCYLADAFPQGSMAPPLDDRTRGPYLQWMFFMNSCIEPAIIDALSKREEMPRSALGYGSMREMLDRIAGAVAAHSYLTGDRFTAADVVVGSALAWGQMTRALPDHPGLRDYLARLQSRPALQRVRAMDEELVAAG